LTTTPFGVGLVGCGRAANDVADAIDATDGLEVVAAFDEIEAAATALARPRGATVHPTLDDLLRDPKVAIIYVGIPHHQLAAAAAAALRSGRHVLCEKPMALDPAEALGLGELAAETGKTLGVFFEVREAGTVQLARELIAGGVIGAVQFIQLRTMIDKPQSYWRGRDGALNWRTKFAEAGGGVLLMNTVHQIDAVRFMTGLEVTRVNAEVATLAAPAGVEVEDTASASLRLSNGGIMSIVAGAHIAGATDEETIGIDGEHGRIEIPSPFAATPVRLFLRRPWGGHQAGLWIELPTSRPEFYSAMIGRFAEAVRAGSEPPATAKDAAAALRVVQAIYASSRDGAAVTL
jgi:predicted dehydrogenase